MTQREKTLKANNKGSSPARGKMPKPFLLLFMFLMPRSGTGRNKLKKLNQLKVVLTQKPVEIAIC